MTLQEIGEALYGKSWQAQLAADLGVADRTFRRFIAGTAPIPPGVVRDIITLCDRRVGHVMGVAAQLRWGEAVRPNTEGQPPPV